MLNHGVWLRISWLSTYLPVGPWVRPVVYRVAVAHVLELRVRPQFYANLCGAFHQLPFVVRGWDAAILNTNAARPVLHHFRSHAFANTDMQRCLDNCILLLVWADDRVADDLARWVAYRDVVVRGVLPFILHNYFYFQPYNCRTSIIRFDAPAVPNAGISGFDHSTSREP